MGTILSQTDPRHLLLQELRHALADGLGAKASGYTLVHIDQITGPAGAGVAYHLESKTMYVLVDQTEHEHRAPWKPHFLAETALDLTDYFRTLVVPAETSAPAQTYWAGRDRDPFVVYKFALPDNPVALFY